MLKVDLQNSFTGSKADNFTVLLLRLIAKADKKNRAKLRMGFPVEVRAVEIYQGDCPYHRTPYGTGDETVVDWDRIAERAVDERDRRD